VSEWVEFNAPADTIYKVISEAEILRYANPNFDPKAKAKAYNTCRAPQAATATSEALVMSQAKLA